MIWEERDLPRRAAVREALAARRQVDAIVRKRRARLRWIAGGSVLTWLPFGALLLVVGQPSGPGTWLGPLIWVAGATLAASATAAVYLAERRVRSRLQSAVARLSPDDARALMQALGTAPIADPR